MTDRPREPDAAVPDGGDRPDEQRVLIVNPASGTRSHQDQLSALAAEHGFAVRETEREGHAVDLASEAASEGASVVAAAGGDGTVNEVVEGLVAAGALDAVRFGIVPTGTGNNFAKNVGITGLSQAFEVMERGDERTVDLGFADDRPFLNSCVGGLTAEASRETTPEMKADLGVVAYVLNTVRTAVDFEGTPLHIETGDAGEETWTGNAVLLLVGNGRRFPTRGQAQADMEDGRFDVAIIEDTPGSNLAGLARSTALERLLGADADYVTRLKTDRLVVSVTAEDPATFSLDGEMVTAGELTIETRPAALRLRVGDAYDPHPDS
ncbi:diacylglycerol/lipid kinase family protein [Halorientalis salina]|uniref:diacylglycerol/lipid kinase family protein n=1 Tax=Halorientalis salina TaxID=2932266 RepID=UPI0010ABB390|nr:diacylglycerol kinase family protein [Halorientalis salina]